MFNKIILDKACKVYIWCFFCLLFIYLLAINFFIPLWADDYVRSLPLKNLTEICSLVLNTYFTWSGRIAVMFFTHLFLWKGTLAIVYFNIVNSAIFVLLVYLIFLNAFRKKPCNFFDLVLLLIIFSLLWFLPTCLGEVAFWKTGSINYLWPITASLAFIYPVTQLVLERSNNVSYSGFITKILFLVSGLLLGTCLENLSVTICILLIGSGVYLIYKKRPLPQWFYYASGGFIGGTILLIIAPGNFKRVQSITKHYSVIYKFAFLTFKIVVHLLPFVLVFVVLMLLLKKAKCKISQEQYKRFYLYGSLALIVAFAMGGVPQTVWFSGRTTFATDVFAIVALVSLISTTQKNLYTKYLWPIVMFILLPLWVLDMTNVLLFYHAAHVDDIMRQEIIANNLAQHNTNISLPPMRVTEESLGWPRIASEYRFYSKDIEEDPNYWTNQVVKSYYHLESIKLQK